MTRRELEIKDPVKIKEILDKSKILHLGLIDGEMPYVVPMNYGYTMENGTLTLYMHSALNGYKLDVIRKNPVCCFEMECDVTPFSGKTPCQYGTSYSSLMGRGAVTIVEDGEEKAAALSLFMKTQTELDFSFTQKLAGVVSILKIEAAEYTAKHRPLPK